MLTFDIAELVRPNIRALTPYRCARDDYSEGILLDANENAFGSAIAPEKGLHRYPDPVHNRIRQRYANLRGVSQDNIFLGVGSDEAIDLLMRVFCVPAKDSILTCPPTYGMYGVCAQVNDVSVLEVPLQLEGPDRFQLRVPEISAALSANSHIKLAFLCSPGNPTGVALRLADIEALLSANHKVIYVIDEAYVDFLTPSTEDGGRGSAVRWIASHPNVVVLQTLSKSFGLAGIRLGIALAPEPIIQYMLNAKFPYNVAAPTADLAYDALSPASLAQTQKHVDALLKNRRALINALDGMPGVGHVIGGGDANFILVEILGVDGATPDSERAQKIYKWMAERSKLVVRYRGSQLGCTGALRITIGTDEEMSSLLGNLQTALSLSPEQLSA